MERRNGESKEELVRMKDSRVPEECLEHVWDFFVWVCKNRTDDFFIITIISWRKNQQKA